MFDTSSDLISRLLQESVAGLDIPAELREAATREYGRVGNWLSAYADGEAGWEVYPQGSFLLNTVVLPGGADEYDVDCVCRRQVDKNAITQKELRDEQGNVLAQYWSSHAGFADGPVRLRERTRCWTLGYRQALRFHLDVLPAIPNPEGGPTAILITDRDLHEWQRSDPQAFAAWFRAQAETEFLTKRLRLAEAARVEPQAIPAWEVKTDLQRLVQILKLHRNEFFAEDLDSRPASILTTTLAAHAYRGEPSLYEAVLGAVERMPDYIQHVDGAPSVANPVEPRENFADRWRERPVLARRFSEWLQRLDQDLRGAESVRGLDNVVARLSEGFGQAPVTKAAGRLANGFRSTREQGSLSFAASTGALSTVGSIPVRNHDFYGEIR